MSRCLLVLTGILQQAVNCHIDVLMLWVNLVFSFFTFKAFTNKHLASEKQTLDPVTFVMIRLMVSWWKICMVGSLKLPAKSWLQYPLIHCSFPQIQRLSCSKGSATSKSAHIWRVAVKCGALSTASYPAPQESLEFTKRHNYSWFDWSDLCSDDILKVKIFISFCSQSSYGIIKRVQAQQFNFILKYDVCFVNYVN